MKPDPVTVARLAAKRIAVATPPANPTVEPELRVLMPADAAIYTTRLPVFPGDLAERNRRYGASYADALASFGGLRVDCAFIAMTGASYSRGPDGDREHCATLGAPRGIPVWTASRAIADALAALGARAIALVSPYPQWLTDQSLAYWRAAGLDIAQLARVSPQTPEHFRAYELEDDEVAEALGRLAPPFGDAIVLSGTGMMSVRTIIAMRERFAVPVLSSNVCGAFVGTRAIGAPASPALAAACPALARLCER